MRKSYNIKDIMASTLVIDGITFLSTREAAKRAGLSHDYIARLAREERIVAAQSGRRWYVDPVSLERFIAANEIEKQARSARLRAERQAEQEAHHILHNHSRPPQARLWAMLQACAVLLLGLSFGQLAVTTLQAPAAQETLAQVWSTGYPERHFATAGEAGNAETPRRTDRVVYETTIAPNTVVSDHYEARSFVLLGAAAEANEAAYLESLFSDTVTVQYLADGRGRIVPELADGPGEAVEFLLVPNAAVAAPPRAE